MNMVMNISGSIKTWKFPEYPSYNFSQKKTLLLGQLVNEIQDTATKRAKPHETAVDQDSGMFTDHNCDVRMYCNRAV